MAEQEAGIDLGGRIAVHEGLGEFGFGPALGRGGVGEDEGGEVLEPWGGRQ